MSKKIIHISDWNFLEDSCFIPFVDNDFQQQGCQIVFYHSDKRTTYLNLLDQDVNNIYTYESNISKIGYKKFEMNSQDHNENIVVVAAKLKESVISRAVFSDQETFKILKKMHDQILCMKNSDLEYLLMNSFNSLLKQDFFTPQEILYGKSLCDICLTDPLKIKNCIKMHYEQQ